MFLLQLLARPQQLCRKVYCSVWSLALSYCMKELHAIDANQLIVKMLHNCGYGISRYSRYEQPTRIARTAVNENHYLVLSARLEVEEYQTCSMPYRHFLRRLKPIPLHLVRDTPYRYVAGQCMQMRYVEKRDNQLKIYRKLFVGRGAGSVRIHIRAYGAAKTHQLDLGQKISETGKGHKLKEGKKERGNGKVRGRR